MSYMSPQAKREQSMYISLFCDLSYSYMDRAKHMVSAPEEVLLMYVEQVKKKPIYRIAIHEDMSIHTTCYDLIDNFAPELKNYYSGVDELPKWVQDKLAVLMLLDHTKQNEEVENVGRRIQENVFWVFKGEADGDDSRSES